MAHGHGNYMVERNEVSRKACKCGKGEVITYEEKWDSDWKGESFDYTVERTCPDACHYKQPVYGELGK